MIVSTRLSLEVVRLLDALVVHDKKQIAAMGLGATANRTTLIESLIRAKATQIGVKANPEDPGLAKKPKRSAAAKQAPRLPRPPKRKAATTKTPKRKTPTKEQRTRWSRIENPEL